MKMTVQNCDVVGGMRPAQGGAAFVRARLVLRCTDPPGTTFILRSASVTANVEGDPLTGDEWKGLLTSGVAMELTEPVPAKPHMAMWLLRRNFSFRSEALRNLKERKALLHTETAGQTWVVLVHEQAAGSLRDTWGDRAFNAAWQAAQRGRVHDAVEDAELATDLARGLVDDRVALVSLLYDWAGDKARSEGYLEMTRNSKGDDFYRRVQEKKERFAKECMQVPFAATILLAPGIHARAKEAILRSFEVFPSHAKETAA